MGGQRLICANGERVDGGSAVGDGICGGAADYGDGENRAGEGGGWGGMWFLFSFFFLLFSFFFPPGLGSLVANFVLWSMWGPSLDVVLEEFSQTDSAWAGI